MTFVEYHNKMFSYINGLNIIPIHSLSEDRKTFCDLIGWVPTIHKLFS